MPVDRNAAARTGSSVPVITIDGPVGAGKGTIGQLVAADLGWRYLDSGALYRVLAFAAERAAVALDDAQGLARLATELQVEFRPQPGQPPGVLLRGEDVTEHVRTERCGTRASRLAMLPAVRRALLGTQQRMRRAPGLVADGRDMGTVVFPDAVLKVFLTASPEVRAQRRYKQLKDKGLNVNLSFLIADIRKRDARDTRRRLSPLKPAEDAFFLDTTALGIDEVAARVLERARAVLRRRGSGRIRRQPNRR